MVSPSDVPAPSWRNASRKVLGEAQGQPQDLQPPTSVSRELGSGTPQTQTRESLHTQNAAGSQGTDARRPMLPIGSRKLEDPAEIADIETYTKASQLTVRLNLSRAKHTLSTLSLPRSQTRDTSSRGLSRTARPESSPRGNQGSNATPHTSRTPAGSWAPSSSRGAPLDVVERTQQTLARIQQVRRDNARGLSPLSACEDSPASYQQRGTSGPIKCSSRDSTPRNRQYPSLLLANAETASARECDASSKKLEPTQGFGCTGHGAQQHRNFVNATSSREDSSPVVLDCGSKQEVAEQKIKPEKRDFGFAALTEPRAWGTPRMWSSELDLKVKNGQSTTNLISGNSSGKEVGLSTPVSQPSSSHQSVSPIPRKSGHAAVPPIDLSMVKPNNKDERSVLDKAVDRVMQASYSNRRAPSVGETTSELVSTCSSSSSRSSSKAPSLPPVRDGSYGVIAMAGTTCLTPTSTPLQVFRQEQHHQPNAGPFKSSDGYFAARVGAVTASPFLRSSPSEVPLKEQMLCTNPGSSRATTLTPTESLSPAPNTHPIRRRDNEEKSKVRVPTLTPTKSLSPAPNTHPIQRQDNEEKSKVRVSALTPTKSLSPAPITHRIQRRDNEEKSEARATALAPTTSLSPAPNTHLIRRQESATIGSTCSAVLDCSLLPTDEAPLTSPTPARNVPEHTSHLASIKLQDSYRPTYKLDGRFLGTSNKQAVGPAPPCRAPEHKVLTVDLNPRPRMTPGRSTLGTSDYRLQPGEMKTPTVLKSTHTPVVTQASAFAGTGSLDKLVRTMNQCLVDTERQTQAFEYTRQSLLQACEPAPGRVPIGHHVPRVC